MSTFSQAFEQLKRGVFIERLARRLGLGASPAHRMGSPNEVLHCDVLEHRTMLAPLLPDMFAWASQENGYLYDYRIEGNLLRFSTAFANQGDGDLELRGGAVLPNGNQEVWQRIYDDNGTFQDRLAGEFTYHPSHSHIHFDGYAIYNLRANVGGVPGDVLRSGGKISFCLIDIRRYDPNAGPSRFNSCGQVQGVSAGWSDVYGSSLADQYIDITGIADGNYFLEVITDPANQLLEADETNNTTIIPVSINGGSGSQGDAYEPNDAFVQASNLGYVADRELFGLSTHTTTDQDFFRFTAVENGEFHAELFFDHADGNLDLFVYDQDQVLIGSATSTTDNEHFDFDVVADASYYVVVRGVGGAINGYSLDFHGPGEIYSESVASTNVPVAIPDAGGGAPGPTVYSTLEGPDLTITDVNLVLNDLRHTYLGDLHINLTSPSGTTRSILTSRFESGGGLLGSQDNFLNTRLDDQSPTNLANGTAPFTGTFNVQYSTTVNLPLAAFNGEDASGTWTISIRDHAGSDVGTLHAWSLEFTGILNTPVDRFELNNDFPQATDLGVLGSRTESGLTIHSSRDIDFYRWIAGATSTADLDLAFLNSDGNLDLFLYDDNLTQIAASTGSGDGEHLTVPVEGGRTYYIVVDGQGMDTATYDLVLDVARPIAVTGFVPAVTDQWQHVSFSQPINQPVVFAAATTATELDPFTVQIRNVTNEGFDVRIAEWRYLDGTHLGETINYFAIEAGYHQLDNGTVLVAGTATATTKGWSPTLLPHNFASPPVVIAQVLADRDLAPVTARIRNVGNSSFGFQLRTEEAVRTGSRREFNWLAIDAGPGTSGNSPFEAGVTGHVVSHNQHQINFANTYFNTPVVLASTNSVNDPDPFETRILNVAGNSASVFLQEEQSADTEVNHGLENIGYFVLGGAALYGPRQTSLRTPSVNTTDPDHWTGLLINTSMLDSIGPQSGEHQEAPSAFAELPGSRIEVAVTPNHQRRAAGKQLDLETHLNVAGTGNEYARNGATVEIDHLSDESVGRDLPGKKRN